MSRSSCERVAANFVKRFGASELRWLLDALGRGDSGQDIANHFSVSRERVRQWKNAFGQVVTLYQVHAEVTALLEEEEQQPEPEPASGGGGVFLVAD